MHIVHCGVGFMSQNLGGIFIIHPSTLCTTVDTLVTYTSQDSLGVWATGEYEFLESSTREYTANPGQIQTCINYGNSHVLGVLYSSNLYPLYCQ